MLEVILGPYSLFYNVFFLVGKLNIIDYILIRSELSK